MSAGNTGSSKAFLNSLSGRRYSTASSGSGSPPPAATATAASTTGTSPRRTSGQFAGLMAQKRGSGCEGLQARRASWDEQKPAAGVVGGWWDRMMKG